MPSLISTAKPEWQPGHYPRLSYRNPLPLDEAVPQRDLGMDYVSVEKTKNTGLSIREIREALPREQPPASQPSSPVSFSQKNKKSLFGGFFAKEPSMVALDQVAQQMMAQHGCTTSAAIPFVSSQKMPEFVPKVNSKWDGVPDHVKTREKEERDRLKVGNRISMRPANSRSRGNDIQEEKSTLRRRNSNTASTSESWDSQSTGSRPGFQDNTSIRPASIYSISSGGSLHQLQHTTSATTVQSCMTFASTRTPESSSSCLDAVSITQRDGRPKGPYSSNGQSVGYPDRNRFDRSPRAIAPSVDAIPEYTLSSATTPLERSPQTPALLWDDENNLDAMLRGETSPPVSLVAKSNPKLDENVKTNQVKSKGTTKVAGRFGLTLQTNNLVVPWESQTVSTGISQSRGMSLSPRGKGRLFGREKR